MPSNSVQSDSKYLLTEHPISFYPTLAKAIGINESIIVQQIRFWMGVNERDPAKRATHFRDGRWWTYNTLNDWQKTFSWQGLSTTKRIFSALRKRGILLREFYHDDKRNRTAWYSIDFEKLDFIVESAETAANIPLTQNETMESTFLSQCVDSKEDNDLYSETTNRDYLTETNKHIEKRIQENPQCDVFPQEKNERSKTRRNKVTALLINQESAVEKEDLGKGQESSPILQKEKKEFQFDDFGWLQFPSSPALATERLIAVRLAQEYLAFEVLETAELVEEDGEWVIESNNGTEAVEEAFSKSGPMSLRALRDYAFARDLLPQDWYNEKLEEFWGLAVGWCREHSSSAIAQLNQFVRWTDAFDLD